MCCWWFCRRNVEDVTGWLDTQFIIIVEETCWFITNSKRSLCHIVCNLKSHNSPVSPVCLQLLGDRKCIVCRNINEFVNVSSKTFSRLLNILAETLWHSNGFLPAFKYVSKVSSERAFPASCGSPGVGNTVESKRKSSTMSIVWNKICVYNEWVPILTC